MSKSVRRARRRRDSPALRDTPEPRRLLERILDTPHLAHVVPRLQPELLHRVIERCGLEDCGALVALATPGQLASIFDLDLWRAGQPGRDERFDADRFGVWLEVLADCGAAVAAQKLAAIDVDLVVAGLAQHARVFDGPAVAPYTTMDGQEVAPIRSDDDRLARGVGGYWLVAKREDSWDAIVAVLMALDEEHAAYFHRLMRGCRSLSNSKPEIDGLHDLLADDEQAMFDVAFDRERRREQQGYATPAQARAFLQLSRQLRLTDDAAPPADPVARAYFRARDETTAADAAAAPMLLPAGQELSPPPEHPAEAVAAVVELLVEAGVLAPPPRALLNGSHDRAPRLARMQAHLQFVLDRDPIVYSARTEELAYLANAILAGCSIQARPFTTQEASDAVAAVCNLGLENWPRHWLSSAIDPAARVADDFLIDHDLVGVFQVGWTVLHDQVGMYAAEQLIDVLRGLRCRDRETQSGLDALRIDLTRHWRAGTPWRARDAFDVIAILDMPAWAALLGLIDECPVLHAAIAASQGRGTLAVSASAFEFISENSQIAVARDFMRALPDMLA
jgi:uncharacterized protein DUF6178